MNCSDVQNLLPEFALGTLSSRESARVAKHLDGECEQCHAQLDDWREVAVAVGDADAAPTANVVPPQDVKERLMHRIATQSTVEVSPPASNKRSSMRLAFAYAAAACVAFVLGAIWHSDRPDATATRANNSQAYQEHMARLQQSLAVQQVRLATLQPATQGEGDLGMAVLDGTAGEIHVHTFGLKPAATNSSLVVWAGVV